MVADERRGHQTGKPLPDQNRTKGGLPGNDATEAADRARACPPGNTLGPHRLLENPGTRTVLGDLLSAEWSKFMGPLNESTHNWIVEVSDG